MNADTAYCVAAYWKDGYGGVRTFCTRAEANAEKEELHRLGYKEVHIWKTTHTMLEKSVLPPPEAAQPRSEK